MVYTAAATWPEFLADPEWAEKWDGVWREFLDDLTPGSRYWDEIEEYGERSVHDDREGFFYEMVYGLLTIDGETVYRAVSSPKPLDPRLVDPVGIYWSRLKEEADPYWGEPNDIVYRFGARANAAALDLDAAIRANMINPKEEEITFASGAKIWVDSCEIQLPAGIDASWWEDQGISLGPDPRDPIIEIRDWRRT